MSPEPGLDIWASVSVEEALALPVKARGELAEMLLVLKLMAMGMIVAKPFGDSSPWDLVVQAGGKLSRLQVKSAWVRGRDGYEISAGPSSSCRTGRRRLYRVDEIDFLVGYVAPEDTWFIFPMREVHTTNVIIRMEPYWPLAGYRERWELLYGEE
jgi:hypothetical protein